MLASGAFAEHSCSIMPTVAALKTGAMQLGTSPGLFAKAHDVVRNRHLVATLRWRVGWFPSSAVRQHPR